MEYTTEISIRTDEPVTQDMLFAVAEIGGVAEGHLGGRDLETTLTVDADSPVDAGLDAIRAVLQVVTGQVVGLVTLTAEEFDRRLALQRPKLGGVTEVAEELGISRQRLATLRRRDDFPAPIEELAAGPVWRLNDLSTFAKGWQRKAGRPRTHVE